MNLRHQLLIASLAVSALSFARPGICAAESYAIDPVHTRVVFRVMHAGFSPSIGTLSRPSGTIIYDEKNVPTSSVRIDLDLASLDMGDAAWNRKVASDFLNTQKYPTASFRSTSVQAINGNLLQVSGDLRVAGGTVPITFNVVINAHKRHPLTLKKTLGMQASTDFSRQALGIDAWSSVVGDRVHLDVSIEAIRSNTTPDEDKP